MLHQSISEETVDEEHSGTALMSKNYLLEENGAEIVACSSHVENCAPRNLLLPERKALWLTEEGLPQYVVFDLSCLKSRAKAFTSIAFDCWHDYPSNPKKIELAFSPDGEHFLTWAVFELEKRKDMQIFGMDPVIEKERHMRVMIIETHGAAKTYLNQVLLFEENPLLKVRKQLSSPSALRPEVESSLDRDERSAPRLNIPRPMSHDLQYAGSQAQYSAKQQNYSGAQQSEQRRPLPNTFETMSSARFSQSDGKGQEVENVRPQHYSAHHAQYFGNSPILDQQRELEEKLNTMNHEILNIAERKFRDNTDEEEGAQVETSLPIRAQQVPVFANTQQLAAVSSPKLNEEENEILENKELLKMTRNEREVLALKEQNGRLEAELNEVKENELKMTELVTSLEESVERLTETLFEVQGTLAKHVLRKQDEEHGVFLELEEENIAPLETANYHKRLAREEDPRSEPNAEDKIGAVEKSIEREIKNKLSGIEKILDHEGIAAEKNEKEIYSRRNSDFNDEYEAPARRQYGAATGHKSKERSDSRHNNNNRGDEAEGGSKNSSERFSETRSEKTALIKQEQISEKSSPSWHPSGKEKRPKGKKSKSNQRVKMLLEKLEEKLDMRQKKLTELNSNSEQAQADIFSSESDSNFGERTLFND